MSTIKKLYDNKTGETIYPIVSLETIYDNTKTNLLDIIVNKNLEFDEKIENLYKYCEDVLEKKVNKEDLEKYFDESKFQDIYDRIEFLDWVADGKPYIKYTTVDREKIDEGYTKIEDHIVWHKWIESQNAWVIGVSEDLEEFPDEMFFCCSEIETIEFNNFNNITHIRNEFFSFLDFYRLAEQGINVTINLKSIKLNNFIKLEEIGNDFISINDEINGYYKLTTIELNNCSNIKKIGNDFLFWCEGLESIDLSSLSQVTSIEDNFLYACSGLTSIDLSPLSQVTYIGNYFLSFCYNLTSIDLSPLSQVTSIVNSFLSNCSKLTSIISPANYITSKIDKYSYSSTSSFDVIHNITSLTLLGPELHTSLGTQWTGEYINPDLKIYVPEDLLDQYKLTFTELTNRFYPIS